jgi:Fe-S-cluster containining protein
MGIEQPNYPYGFNPDACSKCKGNCCIGESGYIWLTFNEAKKIAQTLECELEEFMQKYIFKCGYKLSIKERPYDGGMACIFFDLEERKCTIYSVRPAQCRSFPFWDYFKNRINEVEQECPGIYRL